MKKLFLYFLASLYFFSFSSFAGYKFSGSPCFETGQEACDLVCPPTFGYTFSAGKCYKGSAGGSCGSPSTPSTCTFVPSPTPVPTASPIPSPTPTPAPCADKTDSSSHIGSASKSEMHSSGKFLCKNSCAYSRRINYVFTTGSPTEGDASCNITFGEPVAGCTYYGHYVDKGLGKTCDAAYQDYVDSVTSGLEISYQPSSVDPTPAPSPAPTSNPSPVPSGSPAPTAPPKPKSTPVADGVETCSGTANGKTVFYACSSSSSDTKTSSSTAADGSKVDVTETKETKCIGDACLTKTTTTASGTSSTGQPLGSSTVTNNDVESRDSFCAKNPRAQSCKFTSPTGDEKTGTCEDTNTCDDSNPGGPLPSGPTLYTPKYPDGLSGVWNTQVASLQQTAIFSLGSRLLPNVGTGGTNPTFTIDLNFGAGMNLGTHSLSIDSDLFSIIKALLLCSALIYAYKMVIGG